MSSSFGITSRAAAAALVSGQYDDELTTFYNVPSNANYMQFNGIGRVGVRYDASASGLNTPVKSVWIYFRKYGLPSGNITVGVRKASDDSLVTIGTFPIEHFQQGAEQSLALRLRSNTYQMVQNDIVSVEFPSNPTNGLEIGVNTSQGNPPNCTGRQHNGTTWSNTTNPSAIIIKG
jgi:hypothetical protein